MTKRSAHLAKLLLHTCTIIVISGASACQNPSSSLKTNQPMVKKQTVQPAPLKIPPVLKVSPQSILPTKLLQITHQKIQFNIVTFDTRNQQLIIVDQPKRPGSTWTDAAAAAKANNGIAAINAGFFTPEGSPLGIVISNGNKYGSYNTSSLGTGIFYNTPTGLSIKRRAIWNQLSKSPPAYLLQSGPMLLEKNKTVVGLSNQSSRVRSFIATDGKNHWCIGHADSCTLAQLSEALSTLQIPGFKVATALNLDGGRSSDLWVSSSVTGVSMTIRPFWNKPVRNFLVLKNN